MQILESTLQNSEFGKLVQHDLVSVQNEDAVYLS